jgi:hypothetical protein
MAQFAQMERHPANAFLWMVGVAAVQQVQEEKVFGAFGHRLVIEVRAIQAQESAPSPHGKLRMAGRPKRPALLKADMG